MRSSVHSCEVCTDHRMNLVLDSGLGRDVDDKVSIEPSDDVY